MPRQPKPRWDRRSRRWLAQLGEVSPISGKARPVILRDGAGRPFREEDRAGAYAAFAAILAAREEAERRADGPTVGDLAVAYIAWHKKKGSKPRTVEDHAYHLGRFGAFAWGGVAYEDRPAASIGLKDLTRYRKSMEASGNQSGYIKIAYASILACWRWAERPVEDRESERILAVNPFEKLARPRKGRGRRLVLPWPVIRELLGFAGSWVERAGGHANEKVALNRYRARNRLKVLALRLIAESGARPHEAMELRWGWLQESERVAVIPAEFTKTGKEDRIIGLSPETAAALARIRASGQAHPVFVFATSDDPRDEDNPLQVRQYDEWFRGLRAAAQANGLPIPTEATPYTLRHSFVSQARAGGIDLRELAPAMGHSAQVSESTYAHAQLGEIRDLMDRARAARERSGGGRVE